MREQPPPDPVAQVQEFENLLTQVNRVRAHVLSRRIAINKFGEFFHYINVDDLDLVQELEASAAWPLIDDALRLFSLTAFHYTTPSEDLFGGEELLNAAKDIDARAPHVRALISRTRAMAVHAETRGLFDASVWRQEFLLSIALSYRQNAMSVPAALTLFLDGSTREKLRWLFSNDVSGNSTNWSAADAANRARLEERGVDPGIAKERVRVQSSALRKMHSEEQATAKQSYPDMYDALMTEYTQPAFVLDRILALEDEQMPVLQH